MSPGSPGNKTASLPEIPGDAGRAPVMYHGHNLNTDSDDDVRHFSQGFLCTSVSSQQLECVIYDTVCLASFTCCNVLKVSCKL